MAYAVSVADIDGFPDVVGDALPEADADEEVVPVADMLGNALSLADVLGFADDDGIADVLTSALLVAEILGNALSLADALELTDADAIPLPVAVAEPLAVELNVFVVDGVGVPVFDSLAGAPFIQCVGVGEVVIDAVGDGVGEA